MAQQNATPKKEEDRLWEGGFLAALALTGNVTKAAKAVKKDRATVYRYRKESKEFAQMWDEAMEEAADLLESEARRRAVTGTLEPVFHKGVKVGAVRKYSDTLLIFLMKGARPDKYADRHKVDAKVKVEDRRVNLDRLSPDDLNALDELLTRAIDDSSESGESGEGEA